MGKPNILYDATHLIGLRGAKTPTGMPRVDLGYASYLASRPDHLLGGIQYGLLRPRVIAPSRLAALVASLSQRWDGEGGASHDVNYENVRNFLITGVPRTEPPPRQIPTAKTSGPGHGLTPLSFSDEPFDPPPGAVYLNIAQYGMESSWYFRWLKARPDVKAVFMLHDLLPLDFPHYFEFMVPRTFARMLRTMRRHASALIVSCETTRKRIARYFAENGAGDIPIHVQHLPPEKRFSSPLTLDPALAAAPYAMIVGTVEIRKNHILLLKLWQQFVRSGQPAPRLLVVGSIGWKNQEVLDLLRSTELRGHVMHVSGLSDVAYRHFLGHARALLQPSFMEGYGIPLVEAAAAGTPVIASDLEVFREVCQGIGEFISPTDDEAWHRSILELMDSDASVRRRQAMTAFKTPNWEDYMNGVLDFVCRL